jgi:DNA (cytosine-5)-methyltransferase 1
MLQQRPIAVDLFAGAGGFSLGFEQAGFDVRAAVEIDPIHCATHRLNLPTCATICRDIVEVSGGEIRNAGGVVSDEIDVVIGGSPCQGFSEIGVHRRNDPRNALILEFARIVLELRPKYFAFENVRGLGFAKHGSLLAHFIGSLEKGGFNILTPIQILNAADYGVPQHRRRLFILGARAGLPLPDYPTQSGKAPPTISDALGDLPAVDDFPELLKQDWIYAAFGRPSGYARSLRNGRQNLLTCSLLSRHSPLTTARFNATPPGQTEPVSKFYRLHPNGISRTLRAGTGKESGSYTSARPIHPCQPRCITVREAARLHSYPDWFRFHPTIWHGFRQVGNSVPPLLAQAIASEIAYVLAQLPTPSPHAQGRIINPKRYQIASNSP